MNYEGLSQSSQRRRSPVQGPRMELPTVVLEKIRQKLTAAEDVIIISFIFSSFRL